MERELVIDKKFIPRIILKYKIKAMLKVWIKHSKKSKQRVFKLREWSETEQSYMEKLIFLRDKVRKPLLDNHLIQQYQQTIIFSNLQSMIQLSVEMKSKIDNIRATWNPVTTLLAPTVQSLVIYLKIYKQYSNNYRKADAIIQELKKNPKYKEVITIFNVQDYLIKPVQRPLQYKLFIQDYIKLLPSYHADKPNLQKALKTLLKIADQINEYVEKQMRAQIMVNLQNSFGNLIESTRQYRSQVQAMHPDFNCRLYIFNDLILVVKVWPNNQQEKFTYLYLCGASYVIRQPDCKNFKNKLYICGRQESIHLTFRDHQEANNVKNTIQQLISTLYQKQYNRLELLSQVKAKRQTMVMNRHSITNAYKWKQQYTYRMKLRIEVVGVEKRLYQKQWKIVYAVRYQLGRPETLYQIIFYELSQLKQLQRYLRQVYSNLKIPSLETKYRGMNYDDFKTDFTKYYEYRQILIEDFLNFCLRSKEICKKPEFIVFKLRMHECMWDYLNKFSLNCECEACTNSEVVIDIHSYEKQRQKIRSRKYQFCIINSFQVQNMLAESIKASDFKKLTLQQKLIIVNGKQKKIDYNLQNRGQFGKRIDFHVYVKLVGEQSEVLIEGATVHDTCKQIIEQVCLQKGIQCYQDFALVYVHGKYQFFLDGDQYIYDAVCHLQDDYKKIQSQKRLSVTNRQSIFTNFNKSMDNYGEMMDYSVSDIPKLYMRKVIFLNSALDQKACQTNHQRYQPILGQMLRKFQEQLFLLSSQQAKVFCALFYGIQEYNTIVFSKNIFCNEEKLKKLLPQSKWGFMSPQFIDKVKQILENQVKPSSSILILYRAILVQFGDKQGWITQYFQAQSLDSESLGVKEKDRHVFIGVNHLKVVINRKFNAVNLLQFPILKFEFRTSGDCLWIIGQQKTYTFIGNSWLFFEDLVQKYRITQELETNK